MKKIKLLILAACTAFSCSDDDIIQNQEPSEEYTDILYASAPGRNSSDTKINIDLPDSQAAEATIQWVEGDEFNAFQISTGKYFSYEKINDQQNTSNEAAFGSTDAPADFTPDYAVFPSWLTPNLDPNKKLTVTFPAEYDANTHPSQNIPMLAKVEGKSVHFKHLCGVLRANFKNLPEGFNTVKIVTNRRITGTFTVNDVSVENPVLESAEEQHSDSILVTHTDNQGDYYFPLPVGKYDEIHVYVKNSTDKTQPPHQIFDLANVEVECGNLYNITKNYLVTAEDKDFNQLLENIVTNLKTNNKYNKFTSKKVDAILDSIQTDGRFFPDKYYAESGTYKAIDNNDVSWPDLTHLEYIDHLSRAYAAVYKPKQTFNAIKKALGFWTTTHRTAPGTWFKTQITQPEYLLLSLLRMHNASIQPNSKIPAECKPTPDMYKQVLYYLKYKKEDNTKKGISIDLNPFDKTGSNRTKVAINWIYRACLSHIYASQTSDKSYEQEASKYISIARNSIFSSIAYTTEEGFQHDGSFFQHGQQLYIWGYGAEMLKDATDFLVFLQGTPFSITGKKLEILSNFVLNAYYPTLRGQYVLFNVLGRGISRPNELLKNKSHGVADAMKTIDPANQQKYEDISKRIQNNKATLSVEPYHHHFFRGDYTLHVRPDYTFGVRMVSTHTARMEKGNNENKKGYFLSDGSTCISIFGDEYYNIFPIWNWDEVPGVTAPANLNSFPENKENWGKTPGTSTFAGGVSDGLYGASAYDYNDLEVSINARKSWFFFNQEVVCTGWVNTPNAKTTINQCLDDNYTATLNSQDNKKITIGSNRKNYTNPLWIYHHKVGYIFPKGGNIWAGKAQSITGSWDSINTGKPGSETKSIFALGFNHETTSSTYAYIVVPGIDKAKFETYVASSPTPVQIIQNDNNIQSVYHSVLKIWQAIFFPSAENKTVSCNGLTLKVDQPCAVMVKESDANYEIHVADPSRSQSSITVTLSGKISASRTMSLQGGACAGATATTTITQ